MKIEKHLILFVMLIIYMVSFTTISLAGGTQTLIHFDKTYKQMDKGYVYITIQHDSNPLDLTNEEETIKSFEEVYNSLPNTNLYIYYEIYKQPLDIAYGTGDFFDESGDKESESNKRSKCIQISENVQHDFNFSILCGRLLSGKDYYYKKGNTIPVLMGFDYSKIYEIGKTFTADYLFSTYSFEVVGFLNENCNITLSTGTIKLDNCIIMPSFEFEENPQTEQEYVSQKIHYANKTCGKIRVTTDCYDKACTYFQPIIQTSKIGDYSWTTSSMEKNMAQRGIDLYIIFPVLIALFTVLIVIGIFLTAKYYSPRGKHTNSIPKHILFKRLFSFACVLFISDILSLILSSTYLKTLGLAQYSYWGVFSSIAVLLIGAIIIIRSSDNSSDNR